MTHQEPKKSIFLNKSGQIALLPIIVTGLFTAIASIGGSYISAASATNKELYETKLVMQTNDSALSERLTKQETILPRVEKKVDDLAEDIKDIKRALNIK